ncbi:nuclear transport factor 2 family protein [Nocardia terpenica]|uniref:nuclear transport factor 2 family protein n=1 Tax=Nocardia terpenica TaxID=455432 RepID=UPI0018939B18|nr:nuclear transport factor 2 family protein [Nocardia terpenica]MBF6059216.1 nuclear transport factor 2 family protein [Nocardia terpenica]MBF6103245.1 nuclear transport factor 2 family protein [Nocardia terpenica]MBF6110566.1 nuclear transport factor 2 family protein [Nocardia terpenica]MBF6116697.1 nuclear transport factor 2 family protein [Nocardia terpenica]
MTDPIALDVPADVQTAINEAHHALTELVAGNADSTRKTYWHTEHATLFGAYGGYDTGWSALSRRLDAISPLVADGSDSSSHVTVQTLAAGASGDLAYTVELERHVHPSAGAAAQDTTEIQTLRVTQVYQRAQGTWKLIHRHADPLSNIQDVLAEAGWSQARST